ncbi:MAG: hypothetical protein ACXABI_06420 [Candidatus Hodarchaeales archaeon]|jgi:hypothetical protein
MLKNKFNLSKIYSIVLLLLIIFGLSYLGNYSIENPTDSEKEINLNPVVPELNEISSEYYEIQENQFIQREEQFKVLQRKILYKEDLNMKLHMIYDSNSLVIDGNDNFIQTASSNSWSGNGTELNPYILKDLNVSTLNMSNIDLYFEIENITTSPIDNNNLTISMEFVKNAKIENSVLHDVFVQNSSNIEFKNNVGFLGLINKSEYGLGYSGSGGFVYWIESNKIFGLDLNNSKFYSNTNLSIIFDDSNENTFTVNKNVSLELKGSNNLVKNNFMWESRIKGDNNKLIGNDLFNNIPIETSSLGGFTGTNGIIQNNTIIVNNERFGIFIGGSNHYVANNSFFGAVEETIRLIGNNHILNGNIFNSGHMQFGSSSLTNITVIHNILNHFSIDTGSAVSSVISNNTITYGNFEAYNTKDTIISYNTITSNGVDTYQSGWVSHNGIEIYGGSSGNFIFNNIIKDSRNGIMIKGNNNRVWNNLIVQNNVTSWWDIGDTGFGVNLVEESQFNEIFNNTFLENRPDIYPDRSQIQDSGTGNVIEFNHYDEWISPDNNSDGIVDEPYPIYGTSNNFDYHPLKDPISFSNFQDLPHLLVGLKLLYPNGNENLKDVVTISWTPAIDIHGHKIIYSVHVSNEVDSWTLLESDLTSNIYDWDTSSIPFGFDYLIMIVAECEEGLQISDVSDNTLKILNPDQNDSTTTDGQTTTGLILILLIPIFVILVISKRFKKKS